MMRDSSSAFLSTDFKWTSQAALNAAYWYNSTSISGFNNFPTCGVYGITWYGSNIYNYIGSVLSTANSLEIVNTVYITWHWYHWLSIRLTDTVANFSTYYPISIIIDEDTQEVVFNADTQQAFSTTTSFTSWYNDITINVNFTTGVATLSSPAFSTLSLSLSSTELDKIRNSTYVWIIPWEAFYYSEINASVS